MTLIGSFIDKSYWGISISDFYNNKKNPTFTSLTVITLGFAFIILGLVLLCLDFYNTAIMTFVATVFIILWATNNMYYVFKGDDAIKNDIENLYKKTFDSTNTKEKLRLFTSYCRGWKAIIKEQSESNFQEYKDNFFNFFWRLLNEQDSICVKELCNLTQDLIRSLLISSNTEKKKQGIKFVNDVYFGVKFINSHQFPDSEFMKEFVLISELIREFLDALKAAPRDWIEDNFDWYEFIGCIDTVAITFNTKARAPELTASLQISLQMGML